MYYYFSSKVPSAVKINGVYFGIISNSVKFINVDVENPPFLEIIPLNDVSPSFNFVPDEDFLYSPPQYGSVVNLDGGYLIKINNAPLDSEFKILEQKKFGFVLVTVFNENGLKISIDSQNGFFADSFNFKPHSVDISLENVSGTNLVCVNLKNDKNFLNLYSISGEPKNVFSREVDEFSFENGFTSKNRYSDIAKHNVLSVWEYKNGELSQKEKIITRDENYNPETLSEKIIPYAFLEELCLSGNVMPFLSQKIAENADRIKEYFGNFLGICPPPIFKDQNSIGLIYKEQERKYRVKYAVFDVSDKKITNFKIL